MQLSLFRKKAYVGLDLGHHSVKLVTMEKTPSGWKLTKVSSAPTPTDSIKDGVVVDQEAMAQVIRNLLKKTHVNATTAFISVSGGTVVVRTVRMPAMSEAALRKSIKFEASRYVPSSVEDSFIECEILGNAGDNQMDVLIVAAPKDIVESRIRACEAAGLEVEAVDIEPFATYRALVEADNTHMWLEKTMALVDIGARTTKVSIVNKGSFSMTRSIPQGGEMLSEALRNYFKLSAEDAEMGKSQLDFAALINESAPSENPPLRVLQPHVDDLIREIRRSLNYYKSQQTETGEPAHVTSILLSGGGAKLAGLPEYISTKLGMPVTAVGVLDNPRFINVSEEDLGNGFELSVASGLAMRSFGKVA